MAFKFVVFSCLLALARSSAPYIAEPVVAAPAIVGAPVAARLEEFDPVPQYKFGYDVADSLTGDYKNQQEERNGDLVQGSYSLVDPDGTRRTVIYSADSVNGFNAEVRKEPLVAAAPAVVAEPAVVPARIAAARVVAAPVAAPVVPAAPVAARLAAAPVVAPVARYTAAYSAPFAYPAPVAASYPAALRAAYPAPVARYVAL